MKPLRLVWIAGVVFLLIAIWHFGFRDLTPGKALKLPDRVLSASEKEPDVPMATERKPSPNLSALILASFTNLQKGIFVEGELESLRQQLLSAPPDEALAAIQAFLATGKDALTGEGFAVLGGGGLGEAPTMRVMMLDLLGRICQQHERTESVQQAKTLLEKKTSADEWAVALRNVGWGDPNSRPYLAEKMREMLADPEWRQKPSEGFVEAMDVIVFSHDASFVRDLSGMLTGEPGPLKRASAIALDRLSAEAPLEVMKELNRNPAELADRPFLRADYFAKADVSQAAQRVEVERYLDRTDVAFEEKAKFLAAIAAPGEFISDNLLTSPVSPEDSPQRAQVLVQAAEEWQKNNRFPDLVAPIVRLQSQLRK